MRAYSIKNRVLELHTSPYGASMTALYMNDKSHVTRNLIYGYSNGEKYKGNPFFMGATCGRFAGRIADHGFELKGQRYILDSDGPVHLHGGGASLAFKPWTLKEIHHGEEPYIIYTIHSAHLEGGYPGNLEIEAQYTLKGNSLLIHYRGKTDRTTHLNLTNHNYYNLNGGGSIVDHKIKVTADKLLETDSLKVPTGKFTDLQATPYDLRKDIRLGDVLKHISLDHVYAFSKGHRRAKIFSQETGISMTLTTNQPGVVIFTPADLGEEQFRNITPAAFPAICLEPQNFPDAPNQTHFPSSVLEPGDVYSNSITLDFDLI
ncbi:aldose epimerase family protein [Robertkochia marina]|uniref:aldose epimerase family protein n=1 Tax=Robertkochia marina TaxID=1227945 RepID=UPI001454C836|nr:aldose epimerase family protein [Robertkochia marina]